MLGDRPRICSGNYSPVLVLHVYVQELVYTSIPLRLKEPLLADPRMPQRLHFLSSSPIVQSPHEYDMTPLGSCRAQSPFVQRLSPARFFSRWGRPNAFPRPAALPRKTTALHHACIITNTLLQRTLRIVFIDSLSWKVARTNPNSDLGTAILGGSLDSGFL
ncbi:hypothetical protein K432DRAFT_232247 [Lepidopterella palustris CBS 459.81]|uniref:Uncharacterized protein n=1 Tax=Lepidopterella palustris CBS 459.81 TaxID=1314670 RepID=A0A8E2EE63_9PEZI|nr:hypothetical protein K432DRAFT_232247 [Lepidopterella palustris CBS 459.81]